MVDLKIIPTTHLILELERRGYGVSEYADKQEAEALMEWLKKRQKESERKEA